MSTNPFPNRPRIDEDPVCANTCGEQVGEITADTPTYEEIAALQDLTRAWVRTQVQRKRIPVFWDPELAGGWPWMAAPSSPVAPYPWNPPVRYASHRVRVWATLPGGGEGWFCATGISYSDRIIVSLVDPANVRPLIVWESLNNWIFHRFGLQMQPWPDGPMVAEGCSWVMNAYNGSTPKLDALDIKRAMPIRPKGVTE